MFFLDSVHVQIETMLLPPPKKKKLYVLWLVFYWVIILLLLLQLLLGMQSKSTNKISRNSEDSVSSKSYVVFLDRMFLKWWNSQKQIKFPICHWKIFCVWHVTLWEQFIKFFGQIANSQWFSELIYGHNKDIMWYWQNIMLYFSS